MSSTSHNSKRSSIELVHRNILLNIAVFWLNYVYLNILSLIRMIFAQFQMTENINLYMYINLNFPISK